MVRYFFPVITDRKQCILPHFLTGTAVNKILKNIGQYSVSTFASIYFKHQHLDFISTLVQSPYHA